MSLSASVARNRPGHRGSNPRPRYAEPAAAPPEQARARLVLVIHY